MKRYTLSMVINKPLINLAQNHYDRVLVNDRHFHKKWQEHTNWGNRPPVCDWQNAFTITFAGNHGAIIPIKFSEDHFFQTSSNPSQFYVPELHLLIYQDYKDSVYAEIVTLVPEGVHPTNTRPAFTGFIFPGHNPVNSLRNLTPRSLVTKGYNCSGYHAPIIPLDNLQPAYESKKDQRIGPTLISNTFSVTSGDNIIGNINDYLKCFDNIPGNDHTYQVKLCVIQPNPGKRDPWSFSDSNRKKATQNPVFVGHTYLILTAITPNKTTVRNVGFYPTETVHPYSPISQGILNNDQAHEYDVALTITMTNSQFFNALNYLPKGNMRGFNYNLNNNNCSTFAVDALAAAQIVIPRTIGTWTNGKGMNPGDLGEDLKGMTLSSNMKLQTTFSHHPNIGDCQ
jgi:hypothetical protein